MTENKTNKLDMRNIFKTLMSKKKQFLIVWVSVTILSALYIFPQPRYYSSSVSLAPETVGDEAGGRLASVASSFGFNIGGTSADALYPELYPKLMESNDFVADLMTIKVQSEDGKIVTSLYDYLDNYQKSSCYAEAMESVKKSIKGWFGSAKEEPKGDVKKLNPFKLSSHEYDMFKHVRNNIILLLDKKTDVVTISVQDQDRLICATLADSVRQRLQNFIIRYKTSKTRIDVDYYQKLTESSRKEYDKAVKVYSVFCDANTDAILQSIVSKRDDLENDMQLKFNTYQAMKTQLEAAKAKLQERTPSFTILKSATVPILPDGPKRMRYVLGMLILSTFIMVGWYSRKELIKLFK